jgi:hypothetical protein
MYSTLSETIELEGDFMIVKYANELEGEGHAEVKQNLRKVKSDFSNEFSDMKDI